MDWFIWLSKSDLEPSLVHKYALTFTYNELERDDISYFSHEFLQSMGILLAKHRLEIIKMARKEKGSRRTIHPTNWFVFVLKQTKNYLAKHVKTLVRRENSSNFPIVVPKRSNSLRWKVAMLQRNKRFVINSAEPKWLGEEKNDSPNHKLMLTYGSYDMVGEPHSSDGSESNVGSNYIARDGEVNCNSTIFSSTEVHCLDGEYWSSSTEEIKWDLMFGNLKPT